MSKKDLVPVPEQDKAVQVFTPSPFAEDIPLDKVVIPRLSLLQPLSTAVQDLGFPQGHFFDTVRGVDHGEKLTLIPVRFTSGALYFKEKEGFKCRSVDGKTNMFGDACVKCPFDVYYKKWNDATREAPDCSETWDFLCLTAADLSPVVLTFMKTSFKEGKKLASALYFDKSFRSFNVAAQKQKNDRGTFYVIKVMGLENPTEDQAQAALKLRAQVTKAGFDVADDSNPGA